MESFLDSGAARSVCPRQHCEQFGLQPPEETDQLGFQTATGKNVTNIGTRTVKGTTKSGSGVSMKYAVADIQVPLDSVSQMCDAGATVTFTATGGWVTLPTGERLEFSRKGGTYIRETWVERHPASGSFTRRDP